MRSPLLSLLATIVGLLLVGAGIYGIATSGDDDDEPPTSSVSVPTPAVPPGITPSRNECLEVGRRDPRLAHLDGFELRAVGGETGTARADLICNGETTVLIWRMSGLRRTETSKYFAYLYNSRRDAKQVGTVIGSDGRARGSTTIGPEVDTTRYESLVFTYLPFAEFEERPKRIVFRAPL